MPVEEVDHQVVMQGEQAEEDCGEQLGSPPGYSQHVVAEWWQSWALGRRTG